MSLTPNGSSGYTSDPPRLLLHITDEWRLREDQEPFRHFGELTRFLLLFINGKEGPTAVVLTARRLRTIE